MLMGVEHGESSCCAVALGLTLGSGCDGRRGRGRGRERVVVLCALAPSARARIPGRGRAPRCSRIALVSATSTLCRGSAKRLCRFGTGTRYGQPHPADPQCRRRPAVRPVARALREEPALVLAWGQIVLQTRRWGSSSEPYIAHAEHAPKFGEEMFAAVCSNIFRCAQRADETARSVEFSRLHRNLSLQRRSRWRANRKARSSAKPRPRSRSRRRTSRRVERAVGDRHQVPETVRPRDHLAQEHADDRADQADPRAGQDRGQRGREHHLQHRGAREPSAAADHAAAARPATFRRRSRAGPGTAPRTSRARPSTPSRARTR